MKLSIKNAQCDVTNKINIRYASGWRLVD